MNKVITILRKPLGKLTVAQCVLSHGTGGLNIDASRIESVENTARAVTGARAGVSLNASEDGSLSQARINGGHEGGRWPANVILTESAAEALDADVGFSKSRKYAPRTGQNGQGWGMTRTGSEYDDEGGPSRYFKVIP